MGLIANLKKKGEVKMKSLIMALALIGAQSSFAATTDVWEGPGALFDLQGNSISTYTLLVENTKNGSQIQSNVTITLPDGTTQKEQCLMTETGANHWTSKCDYGSGGGSCFGEGMCISYEADANGKAFATTIAMDGPNDMRLLRTELKNGQAVQFFREKLHKR
jgi:hypothetical protein